MRGDGVTPFVSDPDFTLWLGDCMDVLPTLADGSVDAVVTSPPYLDARSEYAGLRDFEYPLLFSELARVCTGGMLWNVGRIWRGGVEQLWWLELIRSASFSGWEHWDTAIWIKPNANPIHGRVFADSHEYVLVFGRDGVRFNEDAIRRPHAESTKARFARPWTNHRGVKDTPEKDRVNGGRKPLNPLGARPNSYLVAHVGTEKGNRHPAPMAAEIAEDLVSLACWSGQTILDPFAGSGTTAVAARKHGRSCVAIEKDETYARLAAGRLSQLSLLADEVAS
jgi:DNA modification methylase